MLVTWLKERYFTAEINRPEDDLQILSSVFRLVYSDTNEFLLGLHKILEAIEEAMSEDNIVQNNLSEWRRLLSRSLTVLEGLRQQSSNLIDEFHPSSKGVSSPSYRWHSLDPGLQGPHDIPWKVFYQGPCSRHDFTQTKRLLATLNNSIEAAKNQVHRTSSVLQSTMSLIESKRGISQAESVAKLTELAFFFIPLAFSASFFSMPVDVCLLPR